MLRAFSWIICTFILSVIAFFAVAHIGLDATWTYLIALVLSGIMSSFFVRPDWVLTLSVAVFVCAFVAVTFVIAILTFVPGGGGVILL